MNSANSRSISDWAGNIIAFGFTILVNGLANGLPLGGQTTGEISDKYPSLFTPAGYVFSIWGLIYLLLTIFIVWQALPKQRSNASLAAIRIPFLISCVANGLWIFAWHYDQLEWSLVLMLTLLGALIQIYRQLNIVPSQASVAERWILQLPFSIYLGWITVALIANVSALQVDQGWDNAGFSAASWTTIKLALAGTISAAVLFRHRDIAFMLVTVWASVGIAIKHASVPLVGGAAWVVALVGLLLVASVLLVQFRTKGRG